MAVPTQLSQISRTASSNSPAGSDAASTSDDFHRAIQALFMQGLSAGSDVATASSVTVPADSQSANLTGTTTVTALASTNSWDGRIFVFRHTGAHSFTDSSTLTCPGRVSVIFASGDTSGWRQRTSGTWDCLFLNRAGTFIWASTNVIVGQFNGSGQTAVATNSPATTNYSAFNARQAGSNTAFFGTDGTQALCAGSTNGDTVIRGEAGTIRFTIGGTAAPFTVDADSADVPGTLNIAGPLNFRSVNLGNTNYTLVLADAGSFLFSRANTTSKTITIPPNSSVAFPVGTVILVQTRASLVGGTGHGTLVRGAGVRLTTSVSSVDQDQTVPGGFCHLCKVATDEWFAAVAASV